MLTYQIFPKKFASTLSYKKIRVKQIQSNLLAFSRGQLLVRDRHEFDSSYYGDGVRVLSFVITTAQSDTRNKMYIISWLQKISLEQMLLE